MAQGVPTKIETDETGRLRAALKIYQRFNGIRNDHDAALHTIGQYALGEEGEGAEELGWACGYLELTGEETRELGL